MSKVIVTTQHELESLIEESIKRAFKELFNQKQNSVSEFLNLKEAANFLKLAAQTVYGLTSKRNIPFLKRGKKLYFKKDELENWINEGKHKSISEIKAELEE